MKRTHQLDTFVDYVAIKEFKHIMFRCWVMYKNARKFRKEVLGFVIIVSMLSIDYAFLSKIQNKKTTRQGVP